MANAIDKHLDSNLGAPAEKADLAPKEAPELMRDWHQTKGKSELTGECAEHPKAVERAVEANRDVAERLEAVERAIHPDSNRDGN